MKPIICVILSVLAGQSLAQQSAPIGPAESAFKVYELLDEARAISPDNIEMIDASKLSLEELMALAHQERENATRLHCCDWGAVVCRIVQRVDRALLFPKKEQMQRIHFDV